MAELILEDVCIEFPLLHVGHRSLKKTLVSRATGGAILKEADKPKTVRALSNVSAHIQSGDRVGLVGPNGAGKTTILRAMAGIYEPVRGTMRSEGSVSTLLDIGAGMNGELTGIENIQLRGLFMGLSHKQIRELTPQIEEFTELGEFLNMPLRTYSSGMMVRLAFAMATAIKADILLMDEWVLAGDAAFTAKASERLQELVTGAKIMVLASHNHEIIRQWCNKAMYLLHGELKAFGDIDEVIETYLNDANQGSSGFAG